MNELRTRNSVERFTTSRPVVLSQNAPLWSAFRF
jgi:hypothetical protein